MQRSLNGKYICKKYDYHEIQREIRSNNWESLVDQKNVHEALRDVINKIKCITDKHCKTWKKINYYKDNIAEWMTKGILKSV